MLHFYSAGPIVINCPRAYMRQLDHIVCLRNLLNFFVMCTGEAKRPWMMQWWITPGRQVS
jgi:hypothetical protein